MLTVSISTSESIEKVWDCFTNPTHIVNWYFASPQWHCPIADNDLKTGGKFNFRMAAKDGSVGFNFEGIYSNIEIHNRIDYFLEDKRKVFVSFIKNKNGITVTEDFDPEDENNTELQKNGWQAILDNFKHYIED